MSSNNNHNNVNATGITASILVLSIIVSMLIGLISGFFIGEDRMEKRYTDLINSGIYNTTNNLISSNSNNNSNNNDNNSANNNSANSASSEEALYASIDYTKYNINSTTTIQDYYSDNEARYAAANVIGKKLPKMEWTDSNGVKHSTDEITDDRFVIELFMPTCTYCNNSIDAVDAFRNNGNTVVALSVGSGDISNFNKNGEHAFILDNSSDSSISAVLDYIPWVPSFIFVENGVIKLVDFGGMDSSTMLEARWNVAFAG